MCLQPSPLLAMLAESIKQRRCFAGAPLEKPAWYGILCSHSDYRFMQGRNDKNEEADTIAERSGLILSILPRGYCQEWGNTIGMVDTAGTQYLNYNTQTTTVRYVFIYHRLNKLLFEIIFSQQCVAFLAMRLECVQQKYKQVSPKTKLINIYRSYWV